MLKNISSLGTSLNKAEQKSINGGIVECQILCPNYCPKYLPCSCLCDWSGGI